MEYVAKRKAQRNNLCACVQAPATSSTALLLSCSRISTPSLSCLLPASSSCLLRAILLFYPRSPTSLWSRFMPALLSHLLPAMLSFVRTPATGSSLLTLVSRSRTSTTSSSSLVPGPALTDLTFLAFRLFKRAL